MSVCTARCASMTDDETWPTWPGAAARPPAEAVKAGASAARGTSLALVIPEKFIPSYYTQPWI